MDKPLEKVQTKFKSMMSPLYFELPLFLEDVLCDSQQVSF